MRVALLNYAYEVGFASPDALLARYGTLTGWAGALRLAGAEVTVWQRFHHDARVVRDGIPYHFVADTFAPMPRLWQVPWRLHRQALAQKPDILHINGLLFPLQIRIATLLSPPTSRTVVQHHAEKPFTGPRGLLQRWGLRQVDAFFFAARELATPWLKQGKITSAQPLLQIMEGSTWFQMQPREPARAHTGLQGTPLFLWVGRLDSNKDPLTVLAAFEQILPQLPDARLYMIYGTETLLPLIQERMRGSALLNNAVTLLGQIPHAEMEIYYNSADYFILGSHYEGSGYALAEALACGVVPIMTDIPSFRVMTDQGRLGALWPVSDSQALTRAIIELSAEPLAPRAAAARCFFEERLSFPAIGRQAVQFYATQFSSKV